MVATTYDRIGIGYTRSRQADPRWQADIDAALTGARRIVNVGAGAGSYELPGRTVLAVEPSATMIAQRPADSAPVVRGVAGALPVATGCADAATAFVTLHHWPDWRAGLAELRRVARRVVVLHFDPATHARFWLVTDYLPELADVWGDVPSVAQVAAAVAELAVSSGSGDRGGSVEVRELPVPWDCVDGFLPAYWRRPEAYLDPAVRQGMSGLALLDPTIVERGIERLRADLADGTWPRRHADLLARDSLDVGWRLVVAT